MILSIRMRGLSTGRWKWSLLVVNMARIAEPVHNFEAQERDFAHVAELLGIGMCYFPWFEATMKEQVGQSLLSHIGKLSFYNFPYLLTATMTVCERIPC